jgi:hypothetical protein
MGRNGTMGYVAIFEKDLTHLQGGTSHGLPAVEVKLIATERARTAEKELAEHAAQGFRVALGFLAGFPPWAR